MKNYNEVREFLRELEPYINGAIDSISDNTTTSYAFIVPEGNIWSLVKRRLKDKKIKFSHHHGPAGRVITIFCEGSAKQEALKQIGTLIGTIRIRQAERMQENEDNQAYHGDEE